MKIVFISNSNYYFYVHSLSAGHAWFYSQSAESVARVKENRNTLQVHCTWLIWTSSFERGPPAAFPRFPSLSISITYFILTALFHSWLATKGVVYPDPSSLVARKIGFPGCHDFMPRTCRWRGDDDWVLGIETNSNMALAKWQKPAPSHLHKVTTATTITAHESQAKNLLTCPWNRNWVHRVANLQ